MKIKLTECIKFGFGFFIGYELARNLNDVSADAIKVLVERIKKGY